ncbi:hypothetical protein [Paractinoplanes abujensis]|uniref:Uncharacterized protein n=1 Tax=Paractinoplanes abujensis TaxID=882441 RepID=A0A7W7G393_9ACTN|nr:hypothetical protein [Actinoplanes abujensis]MBB4694627.1 hypothetical protein [Actinoplanes abujensis]
MPGDLLTASTGRPGGSPAGPPKRIDPEEDNEVRRSLEMENSGAVTLADRGFQIRQKSD